MKSLIAPIQPGNDGLVPTDPGTSDQNDHL